MKILCTADLHLGRRAARVPRGMEKESLSAADGWKDIVQLALDEKVGLVLMAGDVVDWENRFYEAYGPLEKGVRRLVEAGIPVWAVAGNHDVEALPRLADALKGSTFKLLGRNGQWERAVLEHGGKLVLAVDGWSFRQRYEKNPPLASYRLPDPSGIPRVVMVHGDLDQSNSVYAPVSRAEMGRIGAQFWLLGHIHKPMKGSVPGGAPMLYPGSPAALDPGESGAHGPWLMELDGGRLGEPHQVALSRMRYDTIEIDLTGMSQPEDFDVRVPGEIQQQAVELLRTHAAARALSLRITLTGRTGLHGRVLAERARKLETDLELEAGGVPIGIDKVACRTAPVWDLQELSRGTSPVALLATFLKQLDSEMPGEQAAALVERTVGRLNSAASARPFQGLSATPLTIERDEARLRLRKAGMDLLERLLEQGEGAR